MRSVGVREATDKVDRAMAKVDELHREQGPFGVLTADAPWSFTDKISPTTRGAARHYPTLSVSQIEGFKLPPLKDDAALFLWRVAGGTGSDGRLWLPDRAFDVIRAWGFSYKTEIVWNKRSLCGRCKGVGTIDAKIHAEQLAIPESGAKGWIYSHRGKALCPKCGGRGSLPWFGMGRYTRGAHETCLLATRGKPKLLARNVRSLFEAPVPRWHKGEKGSHSAKPPEFRALVESLFPGPYAELFARGRAPAGWTFFGDQAEALDAAR